MDLFIRFLFDFLSQFFNGVISIVMGFINGIITMFNIPNYIEIVKGYSNEFSGGSWIIVGISILAVAAILAAIVFLVLWVIRKILKFRKRVVEQEELLNELARLQEQVIKMQEEKDDIMAMKVSQLGLSPKESPNATKKDSNISKIEDKVEDENGEDEEADEAEFVESRSEGAGNAGSGFTAPTPSQAPASNDGGFMNIPDGIDEDLPFN